MLAKVVENSRARFIYLGVIFLIVIGIVIISIAVLTNTTSQPEEEIPYPSVRANFVPQLGHYASVGSVAFSPDGTRIVSGSDDGTVRIWDAETGEETAILSGHKDGLESVAYSPDGTRIVSGSDDGTMRIWDAEIGKEKVILKGHEKEVLSVAFSPDGKHIISGSNDGTVRIWNADTGEEKVILKGHEKEVLSVAFNPDGIRIASGSNDGTVRIWDAITGEERIILKGHEKEVLSVAYSPNGTHIASGSNDGTVRIWDNITGEEIANLSGHKDTVLSVAYSPDGTHIVSGSNDGTVRIWDAITGEETAVLSGHEQGVTSVAYSSDGTRIVSGGVDETVRVWDAEMGEERFILSGYVYGVWSVAYSPDGTHIAWGGGVDETAWIRAAETLTEKVVPRAFMVRIWDTEKSGETVVLRHENFVWSVAYNPDGKSIASGSIDGTVQIWDAITGEEMVKLRGHEEGVMSVAYSSDGTRIASGSVDGTVLIWDAETGEEMVKLHGHEEGVWSVAYSPDGTNIASGSIDGTVLIWDAVTGEEMVKLRGHKTGVMSLAYSPDGTSIVSGGVGTVRIWDAKTGEERTVLCGHEKVVMSLAYSSDGTHIASASTDGTIRIWDPRMCAETAKLHHEGGVLSLAYSPDGTHIASGSFGGIMRIWRVAEQTPDLVYQGLRGQGWIIYRPGRLFYTASFDAERQVRIRFNGDRCPIFRFFHRASYCPVYPLAWYQETLRQSPENLQSALQRTDPKIRPKELRMVWERTSDETFYTLGFGSGMLVIVVGFAVYFRQRRPDPLVIAKIFFDATKGYKLERRLTDHMLLLKDPEDKTHTTHYAVLDINGTGDIASVIAQLKKLSIGVRLLFLIQPTSDSDSKLEHTGKARQIGADHKIDVVPLEFAAMERALKQGTCDSMVNEAKDKFVTRQDPYFEIIPITDPNLFFGRIAQLQTISAFLSQRQHVGIFGLRKTGKTSLANQLQLRFREVPVASINCQEFDGFIASQLLLHIAVELCTELSDRFAIRNTRNTKSDYSTQLRSLIGAWQRTGRSEPLVVILDEIDSLLPFGGPDIKYDRLAEGRKVFGVLRALAQELHGLVLLVIAYRPDINRINHLPENAGENPLFMGFQEVYSGSLSPDECDTMIRELGAWRCIEWDPAALRLLYDYCGGHPFVVRLFASDVSEKGHRKKITVDDIESTADTIRRNLRTHPIRDVYKQIVETLRAEEFELLNRIASSPEPMKECRVLPDQEQTLADLENLGLVTCNEKIQFSAKLFEYWVKTRLVK